MPTPLHRAARKHAAALWLTLAFALAPMSSLLMVPAAKALETSFFPVVTNVRFIGIDDAPVGTAMFNVFGDKKRQCTLKTVYALVSSNGVWGAGNLSSDAGDMTEAYTRPEGEQYFGAWTIIPDGESIRFIAIHRCHSLWDTTTELGTI